MKEAAGEANLTVITIVLIGIIAAIAVPLISNLMSSVQEKSCCNNVGGVWNDGSCSVQNTEYTTCIGD